ncbi:Mif2/CENP-C like [Popillia japonica]|uniref:Mif2/CENP-C like n=1 Tax=Popillia japonica TaxID=7064 RepID=A0AAW1IZI2_POPJA
MSITTGGRANGSMGSRANTSIGARANASVAPQPDILFGIRADGSDGARTDISNGDQENISTGDRAGLHQADDVQDHQSNDSQSYAGSEGSWANDGMKAKWLSDLLNGYFGNSKASVTDCSPKEKCATVEQNSVYLRRSARPSNRTVSIFGWRGRNLSKNNSVYLRLEREKLIEEMQTSRSTHNRREGDGNATNVNGNNSRKDIVQPAKNSEQKRRKSQKTKECPSEDVNDEVLDNDAPIDESRRHMSSRLSEKVNKNFNEEIPVANRSRQVVHSLLDNDAPIDESRRHMSSRLSEKVNKNFNEEIPVANRSRQVVHSLRDNTTNNTVTNKSVASNVRHDNHSSTGGELSYDSHAGNADNTRRTNNVVSNKGKRSDYNELSQMEVIENDIFTPVQEDPRRSTKHRKNGRASTGAKQNRKIGKNEEEIGDVSKNLNKTDKKRDLQDAAEPMEDESNQTRSSKRKISSRSSTRSKTAKAKLEAFLLNVANTSPEKLNNSLPKGKRKSEEKLIDEISETFRVPVTPSETFQAPKINVIENRVLTPVDSNENDLKPTPAKKRRGGPKKVIPAIIVAENTDTENSSSDGLRRSTRTRKQRTLLYNPQIIFTNAREFLQFSKINTALQASTIAELNKINLDDLRKKKRSTVAREKSLPAKNPRPRTKQKQKQSVETISEEKNNLDLVENNPIESTILEEDNITTPVQLRTAENTVSHLSREQDSHLSSSDYVQRDVFYISQGNQESRIDWSFPVAKFNDLGTNKNFRTAVGPKSSQDGFQSGSLEILPGRSKPKDKAAKFVLVFSVVEGTGLFQVHDSYQVLSRGGKCYVPLGIYYSIENQSETERLLLDYVKIKPQHR